MWSSVVLEFLVIAQANCLSNLTDVKNQNTETSEIMSLNSSVDIKSNHFRLLLNQESLIRLALERKVHNLGLDVREIKTNMATNNKRLQDKIEVLEKQVNLLSSENQVLRADQSNLTDLLSGELRNGQRFISSIY